MGTTTAQMGLSKPALAGDSGTWDDSINASLDLLDLHDHSTGKGVKVPSAGININADLTFAGFSALNLKATQFTVQAASPALARSLWVKTSNNELYWRNASGTDVQVTSGTSLNLSLVGGIVGDYAAAAAALYYDDANSTYRFLEAAPLPNSWSRVACGGVDLYELASGIANRVRLSSPAALAASYTNTYPAALPGSTLLQQVSSAGVISWSNTVANAVAMGSTLGVTGLITATAGLTAAANQHVTVSGTGLFKHGSLTIPIDVSAGQQLTNCTYDGNNVNMTGASSVWDLPLTIPVGARVTAVTFYYRRDSGTTITFALSSRLAAVVTEECGKDVSAGAGAANTEIGTSPTRGSLPKTIAGSGTTYFMRMSGSTLDNLENVTVTYDQP